MKNYILATEFLKLDKKVQEVFIEWWEPKKFDLFNCIPYGMKNRENLSILDYYSNTNEIEFYGYGFDGINKNEVIPLLQMHQLIDFIEEKLKQRFSVEPKRYYNYKICLWLPKEGSRIEINHVKGGYLLPTIFKAAVTVIENELINMEVK